MAHCWDRGVLNQSSWHGLEEVGTFTDAASIIHAGEKSGAWPVQIRTEALATAQGLKAPIDALVASYSAHTDRILGCNGNRYRATTPAEWRELVNAACAAGAKPTGAFSLQDGSRVLATFEVGHSNGLRTNLLLADSFDGTLKLRAGFTSIRVVCANTLAVSLSEDGSGMSAIRHTASLEEKINVLSESIGTAIATGEKVRSTYERAEQTKLNKEQAKHVFDLLFPKGETPSSATRSENARTEARKAMWNPVNNAGGSLATIWNAATYLVDRTVDGQARKARGDADALNTLLFGTRADRLEEIRAIIEVVMNDGSIEKMSAPEARAHGIDDKQIGKALLADILG